MGRGRLVLAALACALTLWKAFRATDPTRPDANGLRVVCALSPRRAHKTLLLLEGLDVVRLKTPGDLLALRRRSGGRTLVMIDTYGRVGIAGLLAAFYLRAPLVVRLRGHPSREQWDRLKSRDGLRRWVRYLAVSSVQRFSLWRARLVIFNSQTVARELSRIVPDGRSAVVHNPYTPPGRKPSGPPASSRFPQKGFRLLTVTNMNLTSKVDPTLEAMEGWVSPELWEELDLRWVVCGSGRHEERVRETARRLGLEDRISVPGRVEDIESAYDWCDVLVYLTRLDAFPNVPMEAMMREKPVIANADSHGTREQVFDGVNGLVVEGAARFVAALREYAGHPELRERHGRSGKALVEERFSVRAQRREMEKALRSLFEHPAKR